MKFKIRREEKYISKKELLDKLWEMHDTEDKRTQMHKPLSTEWLLCDGRRSAIVDMIATIKHTT